MNLRNSSGWWQGAALSLLLMVGGSAAAQHGGGARGGVGGGFHSAGGFRGGVAAAGYRGGGGAYRGGYGWRGGYGSFGWRGGYYGGYYGGWPSVYGALGFGLFFGALPYAYSTYWWDGVPYYYANNNYYQWDATANAYETVAPPPALATSATQGPAASDPSVQTELFAYPRSKQSAQQQARDRTECQQWAAGQAHNHTDNLRAQAACLEGRGYSVR